MPMNHPRRVPLNGVPQIPKAAMELFAKDIQPTAAIEADCQSAIEAAQQEIQQRYRKQKMDADSATTTTYAHGRYARRVPNVQRAPVAVLAQASRAACDDADLPDVFEDGGFDF